MTMQAYRLRLYTPLFSYGANQQVPEIRAASIRGVLHWWFRALGGTFEQEREIFGGISLGNNHPLARRSPESAARLVLRTSIPEFRSRNYARLPHKSGGPAASAPAIPAGTDFELFVSWRRDEPLAGSRKKFDAALRAWMLAGSFGMRATRGAGAIQNVADSFSVESWKSEIERLVSGTSITVRLLPKEFQDPEVARKVITDTIGGPFRGREASDLQRIRNPLGLVFRGNRKTSPLRLTIRQIGGQYRIVSVWDGRQAVTGNREEDLKEAIRLLQQANKEIGDQLAEVW